MYKIIVIASYVIGFDIIKYLEDIKCESIQTYEGKGTIKLAEYRDNAYDDIKKIIISAKCKDSELNSIFRDIYSLYDFKKRNTGIMYAFKIKDSEQAELENLTNITEGTESKKSYNRFLFQVPYGFSDDVILLSETIDVKGGTVVESFLDPKENKSEEEYEYMDNETMEDSKRTVAVIIITDDEKSKQLLSISKSILPRIFRNKSFKVGVQKIDRIAGITV